MENTVGEAGAEDGEDGENVSAGARVCPGRGGALDWYLWPVGVLISS